MAGGAAEEPKSGPAAIRRARVMSPGDGEKLALQEPLTLDQTDGLGWGKTIYPALRAGAKEEQKISLFLIKNR